MGENAVRLFSAAWAGLGRVMFEAVSARDYPVLMGGFLLAIFLVIISFSP